MGFRNKINRALIDGSFLFQKRKRQPEAAPSGA